METRDYEIDYCAMSLGQTHMHFLAGSCPCETEACFPTRSMYFGDDKEAWEPR